MLFNLPIHVALLKFCAIILFLLIFFLLVCYCSMWLYFSPGDWLGDNKYCPHFLCFFLKLGVIYRMFIIYVRENNDYDTEVMII